MIDKIFPWQVGAEGMKKAIDCFQKFDVYCNVSPWVENAVLLQESDDPAKKEPTHFGLLQKMQETNYVNASYMKSIFQEDSPKLLEDENQNENKEEPFGLIIAT